MMKINFLARNMVFALTTSILTIIIGFTSNSGAYYMGGWAVNPDKRFVGLLITSVFLIAWLLYGMANGRKKENGFIKFISLYWGIGGLIGLTAILLSPIGQLAIIVIPIDIIILVPTYGLTYFYTYSSDTLYLVSIVSMITSWSAGMIGYFLGYLLKKAKGQPVV